MLQKARMPAWCHGPTRVLMTDVARLDPFWNPLLPGSSPLGCLGLPSTDKGCRLELWAACGARDPRLCCLGGSGCLRPLSACRHDARQQHLGLQWACTSAETDCAAKAETLVPTPRSGSSPRGRLLGPQVQQLSRGCSSVLPTGPVSSQATRLPTWGSIMAWELPVSSRS